MHNQECASTRVSPFDRWRPPPTETEKSLEKRRKEKEKHEEKKKGGEKFTFRSVSRFIRASKSVVN